MNNIENHCLTEAYNKIKESWENILEALKLGYGLNYQDDENFDETPHRNAKALLERCSGINSDKMCKDMLINSTFPSDSTGLLVLDPITVHSLCPHHFEDVKYVIRVGYIPSGRCIGLSKFARVVKLFGSQPILQETFTKKLADMIQECIQGEGCGIIATARHNCMVARGVKEPGSKVTMVELRGSFLEFPSVKEEFYTICDLHSKTTM
jgi:GTP cyclohydrolase IA